MKTLKMKFSNINNINYILSLSIIISLIYSEQLLNLISVKSEKLLKIQNILSTKKIQEKFVENCEELITCESCLRVGERCGWCYSDGLCKSGNQIGSSSSSSFCPFQNWENKKCEIKKCNLSSNRLSCITQDNCYWCENHDLKKNSISGKCEDDILNKNSNKCSNIFSIEDYFKNPKLFKSRNNYILDQELEKLYYLGYDKNIKNNIENNDILEKEFLNYEKFLKSLKLYMNSYSNSRPTPYNSLFNPAGIFNFQNELLNSDKNSNFLKNNNIQLKDFNPKMLDVLSQDSKREMIQISKKIALENLIKMFEFIKQKPYYKINNIEKFNLKEYKILEKISGNIWEEFLTKKEIKLIDLRNSIGFFKNDPDSEYDIKNIIEQVKFF